MQQFTIFSKKTHHKSRQQIARNYHNLDACPASRQTDYDPLASKRIDKCYTESSLIFAHTWPFHCSRHFYYGIENLIFVMSYEL